eukprot:201926_1
MTTVLKTVINKVSQITKSLPKEGEEYVAIDSSSDSLYKQHPGYKTMRICPLLSGEEGLRGVLKVQKGHIEEAHFHTARFEAFILDGKFKFTNPVSTKECILTKGSYYCNPPKCPHTMECLEAGAFLLIFDGKPDVHAFN